MGNMKSLFPGFYPPSQEDFVTLWENCIFVFDANVFLDLYRYTDETKDNIIQILNLIKDRIWLPYQVAYEFHKNMHEVILQQKSAYSKVRAILSKSQGDITNALNIYNKHSTIDKDQIIDKISTAFNEIYAELENKESNHPDILSQNTIVASLIEIIGDKIGKEPDENELNTLYKKAEDRYSKSIPPGHEDKKKPIPERYGDYIIWDQIIHYSKDSSKDIIFVTGDEKQDWFSRINGKTTGPNPKLINEFSKRTSKTIYIYTTSEFMKYSPTHIGGHVEETTVPEVESIAKSRDDNTITHDLYKTDNAYCRNALRDLFDGKVYSDYEAWSETVDTGLVGQCFNEYKTIDSEEYRKQLLKLVSEAIADKELKRQLDAAKEEFDRISNFYEIKSLLKPKK